MWACVSEGWGAAAPSWAGGASGGLRRVPSRGPVRARRACRAPGHTGSQPSTPASLIPRPSLSLSPPRTRVRRRTRSRAGKHAAGMRGRPTGASALCLHMYTRPWYVHCGGGYVHLTYRTGKRQHIYRAAESFTRAGGRARSAAAGSGTG